MKVFVAGNVGIKGRVTNQEYHWCEDGEILVFSQIKGADDDISMCGIDSRTFTTHIVVKELNISIEYYRELITDSTDKAVSDLLKFCKELNVKPFNSELGLNLDEMIDELIDKASKFIDGDKVKCLGRNLSIV